MPQPVESAGEWVEQIADRGKACADVPTAGVAGVNVRTQGVVCTEVARHPLQVCSIHGTCTPQRGDDGIVDVAAIAAQPGAETAPRRQAERGIELVSSQVADGYRSLPVFEAQTGTAAAAQRLVDVDVAMGLEGQPVGVPTDRVVDHDVAVGAAAATTAINGDIITVQAAAKDHTADITARGSNGEINRVNQPGASLASRSLGANLRTVGNLHLRATGLDEATVGARVFAFGPKAAADCRPAVLHVGQQDNFAFFVERAGGRFDNAVVVDDGFAEFVQPLGSDVHDAAFGQNDATVVYLALQGALVNGQTKQPPVGKLKTDTISGSQFGATMRGVDLAAIGDVAGNKGNVAPRRRPEVAKIFDPGAGVTSKTVVPVEKVFVTEMTRAGNKPANIDLGTFAKENAVGVDDEDLPIGGQTPQQLT